MGLTTLALSARNPSPCLQQPYNLESQTNLVPVLCLRFSHPDKLSTAAGTLVLRSGHATSKPTGKNADVFPLQKMTLVTKGLRLWTRGWRGPDVHSSLSIIEDLPFRGADAVYATLDAELHEQMFRSGGQSDAESPEFSFQANLVLIYRPTEDMKGSINHAQLGI
ncbi:hypothetical protein TNCV_1152091 [Trichonephila clavipes]|nr:hypothetical protein TNCV_1152091 [Trichonephila clavipes]